MVTLFYTLKVLLLSKKYCIMLKELASCYALVYNPVGQRLVIYGIKCIVKSCEL